MEGSEADNRLFSSTSWIFVDDIDSLQFVISGNESITKVDHWVLRSNYRLPEIL